MCRKGSAVWPGTLLLLLSWACPAAAAETAVIPSVELRQEYTDNLFFSATNPQSSFITRLSPGIKANGSTEVLSGSLAAKLSALHYSENSNRDDLDQVYRGTGGIRLTPQLKLTGSAAYRNESSPDRDIEASGQALNVTSWHQSYGSGVEQRIGELTVASLGYGYDTINYSKQINNSDVTSHTATIGLEHDAGRLLPLLKLHTAARYSRSDYDTAQIENYELTIGVSRQLHELWSLSANGGARFTRSGFQTVTFSPASGSGSGHEQNDSFGWVLATSLDYRGELLRGSLTYNRDLSTASGSFRSAVERDVVNFNLRRQLNYEFSAALGGGYYRSFASGNEFGSQNINDTSWRGTFSLRYEFNRTVSADGGYEYYFQESASSNSSTHRNKLFFQLTAQTTLFE